MSRPTNVSLSHSLKIGLLLRYLSRYLTHKLPSAPVCLLVLLKTLERMAPKSGDKKPAQPAKKAVAKKSTGGRKKGSKKAVESYKIYIYKVRLPSLCRKLCIWLVSAAGKL